MPSIYPEFNYVLDDQNRLWVRHPSNPEVWFTHLRDGSVRISTLKRSHGLSLTPVPETAMQALRNAIQSGGDIQSDDRGFLSPVFLHNAYHLPDRMPYPYFWPAEGKDFHFLRHSAVTPGPYSNTYWVKSSEAFIDSNGKVHGDKKHYLQDIIQRYGVATHAAVIEKPEPEPGNVIMLRDRHDVFWSRQGARYRATFNPSLTSPTYSWTEFSVWYYPLTVFILDIFGLPPLTPKDAFNE